ncbi:unnamed protein product [Tuber melanosporum]|uniref:(Perigord truffle) hypothetical protein n=1 Tax=Tuber melanosporum (strain Mel28) TaxID=656061 RepID=D5GBC3_TUBMM|nr:uncharacterized protein GSTUM_00000413001 [Tuber melanosporum]CAZ81816.1 unnamed protein product [Tuber melanosporum]
MLSCCTQKKTKPMIRTPILNFFCQALITTKPPQSLNNPPYLHGNSSDRLPLRNRVKKVRHKQTSTSHSTMTDIATPFAAALGTADIGKKFVQKPEKPDQTEFEKRLKEAQEEHDKVRQKLSEVKAKLDLVQVPGKNPLQNELREKLSDLRSQQSTKKNDRARIDEEIKTKDSSLKAKIKEFNARKEKIPYKTLEELEKAVKTLEKSVEKGDMTLVGERKALSEISTLQKQRKIFGALDADQKAIDEEREKLEELKAKRKDPDVQRLSDEYEETQGKLDAIKAEQDEAFGNLNKLRDERSSLYDQQKEKWQNIQDLKDDYYSARNAYREYEKEAWRIRREKKAKEDEEYRLAKKREAAQQKMEEASQKAYTSEILTCEGLVGYFDPSSAEAARKAKLLSEPRVLAAQPTRSVGGSAPSGKKLIRKDDREEGYFTGKPKKGKKGKKNAGTTSPNPETSPATPARSASGKINLPGGVVQELIKVDILPPSNKEDVQRVLKELRGKLAWYKDNQDQKTTENIAKAQKEIDRLEAEDFDGNEEKEVTNGTSTPNEEPAEAAIAESGEKGDETEEKAEEKVE